MDSEMTFLGYHRLSSKVRVLGTQKGPPGPLLLPQPSPAITVSKSPWYLDALPRTILGTWAGVTGHSLRRVVMREAATCRGP